MVVISGDIPPTTTAATPIRKSTCTPTPIRAAILRPFVKRAWQVHRAQDLARFTERAFWTATSGRPGAVLLSVPMDHFSRPVPAASHPLVADAACPR